MKKYIISLSLFVVLGHVSLFAQLPLYNNPSHLKFIVNINNTYTPPTQIIGMYYTATDMINELTGAGIQAFNVKVDSFDDSESGFIGGPIPPDLFSPYICPLTYGKFKWVGGLSDIGIDSGMAMCTGWQLPNHNLDLGVINDSIPGIDGGVSWPSYYNSGYYNEGGEDGAAFAPWAAFPQTPFMIRNKQWPDLVALNHGDSIADANIIQFDFVPDSNHIQIQYVFASEEYPNTNQPNYPATVCDTPNDVMGILLSGPGIQGEKNIALIPGTNIPVGVNTITPSGYKCGAAEYSQYYVDNSNGRNVIYNGFTTVLTAESAVIPRDTYHLKLAVADGAYHPEISDSVLTLGTDYMPHRAYYDSGIFFKAGSFLSYTKDTDTVTSISEQSAKMRLSVSPNPFGSHFSINAPSDNHAVYRLLLTDAVGREILNLEGTVQQLNQKLATASLEQLPSGNYFMDIWLGKNTVPKHFKLVKRN